jgi:hypothetical protein
MGTRKTQRSKPRGAVRGSQEPNRLEESLWKLVFEELWPVVSRTAGREATAEGCGEVGREREGRPTRARGA